MIHHTPVTPIRDKYDNIIGHKCGHCRGVLAPGYGWSKATVIVDGRPGPGKVRKGVNHIKRVKASRPTSAFRRFVADVLKGTP